MKIVLYCPINILINLWDTVEESQKQIQRLLNAGVNLIIYILTGNYKEDQVHIPALLERLGEDDGVGDFDIQDGVIP